jgi:ABC-2 type transport system permease protein
MSSFYSLLRISLLNYFSLTAMRVRYFKRRERLWEPLLIGFAIVAGGGSFGTAFYYVARSMAASPYAELALTTPILFTQVIALLLGMFALLSVFYFSNDLDILVPLPLKEKYILAAKFMTVNITEYIPALFVFVPAIIAYNQAVTISVVGWLSTVVVFLLLPVIPLALMGIIAVTMMRGLNRKHRDVSIVVASLVLVGAILYFQYFIQSAVVRDVDIEALIQNQVDVVRLMGVFFPPSIWATRAISQAGTVSGLLNMGYLVLASALSMALFLAVGEKNFYGGLVGGAEKDRKGVLFNERVLARKAIQSSVFSALLAREWRLFIRVPIWVLNGFFSIILIPLLMFFPAMTMGRSIPELAAMVHFAPNGLLLGMLVVAALIAGLGSLNTLASTSVSREGKHLWLSRSLPVSPSQQVMAKLAHAALGSLISAVPVSVTFALVIAPGAEYVLGAVLLGIVFGATPQILGLLFDLWRPFLTWTNPQHAVKNNLNAIFPMLILGALGFGTYWLTTTFILPREMGHGFVWLLLTLAHLALGAISLGLVLKWAPQLYAEMENKG